jgi:hypothetical protein
MKASTTAYLAFRYTTGSQILGLVLLAAQDMRLFHPHVDWPADKADLDHYKRRHLACRCTRHVGGSPLPLARSCQTYCSQDDLSLTACILPYSLYRATQHPERDI